MLYNFVPKRCGPFSAGAGGQAKDGQWLLSDLPWSASTAL